jgi:hypothetical protein
MPKSSGRYKGGSNGSSTKKRTGQRKKMTQPPLMFETVVELKTSGKIGWFKRPIVKK